MAVYPGGVPLYEYRCPTCHTTFELRRPMAESGAEATCPGGHRGATRVLSVFAAVGATASASAAAASSAPAAPCGGACSCYPG